MDWSSLYVCNIHCVIVFGFQKKKKKIYYRAILQLNVTVYTFPFSTHSPPLPMPTSKHNFCSRNFTINAFKNPKEKNLPANIPLIQYVLCELLWFCEWSLDGSVTQWAGTWRETRCSLVQLWSWRWKVHMLPCIKCLLSGFSSCFILLHTLQHKNMPFSI